MGRLVPGKVIWLTLVLSVILSDRLLNACTLAVFQYALEMWEPAPYEALLFHRGAPSRKDQALLSRLKNVAADTHLPANLIARTIDLSAKPGERLLSLYHNLPERELPWLVILYPCAAQRPRVLWSGRPDGCRLANLVNSPVRREIADRLIDGNAAVWVLLESGRKTTDESSAKVLASGLARMEETLVLAKPTDQSPSAPPVHLRFSMVRVSRTDPAEQMLVNMLLGSEGDLREHADRPMAFPVFGRGRVLYALVGKGINADNIRRACEFLIEPCSCLVKVQNPGVDLLMAVNWDDQLDDSLITEQTPPPLSGITDLVGSGNTPPTVPAKVRRPEAGLTQTILILLGSAGAFVVITTLVMRLAVMKKRPLGHDLEDRP